MVDYAKITYYWLGICTGVLLHMFFLRVLYGI